MPSACAYVTIALAGATCPRVNGGKAGQTDDTSSEPEPFALQGKLFTELRVLNRELGVAIHSASTRSGSDGTLLGTILHPKVRIVVDFLFFSIVLIISFCIHFRYRATSLWSF